MTTQEAQNIVNRYRSSRDKGSPHEYMEYMKARCVLDAARFETLTAGQRGFCEAAGLVLASKREIEE